MRMIATFLSLLSLALVVITMMVGLKTAHGQDFYLSHLKWAMLTLGVVMLTQAFALMFIFKMHSIIHDLVRQLDGRGDPCDRPE